MPWLYPSEWWVWGVGREGNSGNYGETNEKHRKAIQPRRNFRMTCYSAFNDLINKTKSLKWSDFELNYCKTSGEQREILVIFIPSSIKFT